MVELIIKAQLGNAEGNIDLRKVKEAFANASMKHVTIDMVFDKTEVTEEEANEFINRSKSKKKEEEKPEEKVLEDSTDIEEAANEVTGTEPVKTYTGKDISRLVTEIKNKLGRDKAAELVHKYAQSVSKLTSEQLPLIGAEAEEILKDA